MLDRAHDRPRGAMAATTDPFEALHDRTYDVVTEVLR
jgi:hypothetical protein